MVVDFVDVTSIDSVGLETLMQGLQRFIDAAVPPRRISSDEHPTQP
jgi:anti-anti-sigma regulatory factor